MGRAIQVVRLETVYLFRRYCHYYYMTQY